MPERETPGGAPTLRVVADQMGSPTYTVDLAGGLLDLLAPGGVGLFHLTAGGSCSRYELALETLRLAGIRIPGQVVVEPVASDAYPTKARRPRNSVLDCGKAERTRGLSAGRGGRDWGGSWRRQGGVEILKSKNADSERP